MRLEHEFTVPVPVDEAWPVLLDIERIAPCMPGASLDTVDGDGFTGSVKVKLGPINLTYKGAATFTQKDADTHTAVIDARGRDSRGNGTAAAVITANLEGAGQETKVKVATDLNITGKPAQFGRGVMSDVGNKLIGQFADCLAGKLGGDQPEAEAAPVPAPDTGADADSDPQKDAQDDASAAGGSSAESGSATRTGSAKAAPAKKAARKAPAKKAPAKKAPAKHESLPATAADSAHAPSTESAPASAPAAPAAPAAPVAPAAPAAPTAPTKSTPAAAAPERPSTVAPTRPSTQPEAEPIDLLQLAGGSVAKRVVPAAAVLALLTLLFVVLRRRTH